MAKWYDIPSVVIRSVQLNMCPICCKLVTINFMAQIGILPSCSFPVFQPIATSTTFFQIMNSINSHSILIWRLLTLLQPAPVVLGLFTKRRECWGSQPLGGNGSFPWESLSRIWPLRPWMNSSECWFLEIWRAAAIASDCLSNVEVNLELPSPLIPHLSPTGTTCWFLPIYYTSFLHSVLTYMP